MPADPLNVLVVTKGHPFDEAGFRAMLAGDRGLETTFVEQPAAQVLLRPEHVGAYGAVLFYDFSGIVLPGSRLEGPMGAFVDPPDDYRRSMEALLERGTGLVLLNHALLSWPSWPLWRELSGTSFVLREGVVAGRRVPGSGFRGGAGEPDRNAKTHVRPAAPGHPVLAGLDAGFAITDELYLKTPGFEADVLPLLRSDFAFVQENFTPPPLAPPPERAAWQHPPGSDLVVWAKASGRSPVVACELGDGPEAYANPGFRRLVGNALRWVASQAGRDWAAASGRRLSPRPPP